MIEAKTNRQYQRIPAILASLYEPRILVKGVDLARFHDLSTYGMGREYAVEVDFPFSEWIINDRITLPGLGNFTDENNPLKEQLLDELYQSFYDLPPGQESFMEWQRIFSKNRPFFVLKRKKVAVDFEFSLKSNKKITRKVLEGTPGSFTYEWLNKREFNKDWLFEFPLTDVINKYLNKVIDDFLAQHLIRPKPASESKEVTSLKIKKNE